MNTSGREPTRPRLSDREQRERGWRIAITIAIVIFIVVTSFSAIRKAADGRSAFLRWQPQVRALMHGENVYAPTGDIQNPPYPNTPIVGMMLAPMASLPDVAGAVVFLIVKIAATIVAAFWSLELARGRRPSLPAWVVGLVVLLAARPIMSDLQHGNINLLVLFIVTAGLVLFSRGRLLAAGMVIGLAVVVKVTPALFVLYFAWKRQWRALLGCGLGIAIAVTAPALILGPKTNIDLHRAWFDQMIAPFLVESEVQYTEHINQSLPGVVMRLMTYTESVDTGEEEYIPVNLVSLDPETAQMIIRVLLVSVLAWLAFVCRTPVGDRRDWRLACEFALVFLAMLMLSERTWKHHYVTVILPLACVASYLALEARTPAMRRYLIATLAVFFALTALMSGELVGWIYQGVAHKFVEAFGSFFWAGVALFAALSVILLRERKSAAADRGP